MRVTRFSVPSNRVEPLQPSTFVRRSYQTCSFSTLKPGRTSATCCISLLFCLSQSFSTLKPGRTSATVSSYLGYSAYRILSVPSNRVEPLQPVLNHSPPMHQYSFI